MNFKEVLLVVNPIAGDINKNKIVEEVKTQVKKHHKNFYLYTTSGDNDEEKIRQEIEKNKIDRLIVAGGDGTINMVAEAIKDLNIPVGIIPAGSANGLAVNLDLPPRLPEQVRTSLGSKLIEYDILCLNDIICLHMSDLGINAELIKNYESSNLRGKFGYLLQSIPTLIKSEFPYHFTIKTDDFQKEVKAVLLGFANASKYGTGANVNPHGKPNDGLFEVLIFKRLSLSEIVKTLRNETDFDPEVMEIVSTRQATITCKRPVPFQVDGEYIGKETEVEIKILPEKLSIAIP